jgi:hypothetical protein
MRAGHKIVIVITLVSVLAAISVEWIQWVEPVRPYVGASIVSTAKASDLIRLAANENNYTQIYNESNSISQSQRNPDTPSGTNVSVQLPGIVINFETVVEEGVTNLLLATDNPAGPLPPDFYVSGPFIDITTTVTYSGTIMLGIRYDELRVQNENKLGLYHWNGVGWEDATTWVDTTEDVCYGEVSSLSWFFVGGRWVQAADPLYASASVLGKALVLADEVSDPFITVDSDQGGNCSATTTTVQVTECGDTAWCLLEWIMMDSVISWKYVLSSLNYVLGGFAFTTTGSE